MDIEKITREVVTLSREAGDFIKKQRENFDPSKIEYKGHSSNLVSYVDKETEKILVNGLKQILPTAGFITEEGTVEQYSNQDYCWLIDPLDGTTNFLHNVPIYCTSIGLMHAGKMISGVVYDMNREECFYAWQGGGAWCNQKPIRCAAPESLSTSLIATGFPYYKFDKYQHYMQVLETLIKNSHGLRRCGSAAIDLCWVAAGRFDGYFEYNINAYDIAAGIIILQEAGGKTSDFKGGNDYLFGKNIVAAAGSIHQEFVEMVAQKWHE